MEIIIENENTELVEYNINFEQAKAYLQEEMKKYNKLVVTDEFIQMAKKSRAELNAKKKELKERLTAVKKKHNEPIDKLKLKVDELLALIEEPLSSIDERIKEYEVKLKEQKLAMITEIFVSIKNKHNVDIKIDTIFNQKWLNTDYSKKKITEEITCFFERVTKDLEVIESFEDEFVIPLKEIYMTCFDMSIVMQKKIAYDKEKQRKIEKEQEKLKEEVIEEIPELTQEPISDFSDNLHINTPKKENEVEIQEPTMSGEEKIDIELIEFWVEVTPHQKLLMRNFVLDNHIKCGKIQR